MEDHFLDHVHVADSNAARALVISHWLERSYRVKLAAKDDPDVHLDNFIDETGQENKINKVAGAVANLDPLVPGWNSVGREYPPLGSLGYILRKYVLGSRCYKAGPILIYGKKESEQIAELTEDRLGFNLLKLPGVRYRKLPEKARGDNALFIARQFEHTISRWQDTPKNFELHKSWRLLERNRLIASGLFQAIRRASRPLVHTYNALRATKQFHEIRPDSRWHAIDVLAVYADRHLRYESDGKRPPRFREILQRFHSGTAKLPNGKEQVKRIELVRELSSSLSDLESLIRWWESLIAWSNLAVTHNKQAVHSVIVDDDPVFAEAIQGVLESEAFGASLERVIGRKLPISVTRLVPAHPEEVIRDLRENRIHDADAVSGSPVVIFQDLILHEQSDFGLRVIRRLRGRYPWLRIVALTSREKARFEILEAGADIYLNKANLLAPLAGEEEPISGEKFAENLSTILRPGAILLLGDAAGAVRNGCLKLLCERYWLDPRPILMYCDSADDILSSIPPEAGPPRLLLVPVSKEISCKEVMQQLLIIRRLAVLFPELVIILWRPQRCAEDGQNQTNIVDRWFEICAKWIPDYPSRVLPIDRRAAHSIGPPSMNEQKSDTHTDLDLLFSADELAAAELLLRRSAPLPKLAAYNFYVPRRRSPEGATGPIASPTKVETEIADKIATRFGGCSVSVLHGRWVGEKGTPDYDTVVAIESFAPATRSNRAFALEVVREIKARLEQEAVLQIERPVSVMSRDEQKGSFYLSTGLCDEFGAVDGAHLLKEIYASGSSSL